MICCLCKQGDSIKWNMPWRQWVMLAFVWGSQPMMVLFWLQRGEIQINSLMKCLPQKRFTSSTSKFLRNMLFAGCVGEIVLIMQCSGFSIEAGTWRLIATNFGLCNCLIYIPFAAFPSPVYSPSICHSFLLRKCLLQILLRTLSVECSNW